MKLPRKGRFAPQGYLALDPRAWGMFFAGDPARENERRGDVVIVSVRGPLMHHEDWLCDSYDAIKARVLAAIAEKPSAIVMSIDSPGGLVSGCFDTTDEIRDACIDAQIPLYAFVDGQATSAAYALACAASRIVIPPTGIVGSIGVIDMLVDVTAQDQMMGVATRAVASGARKTDGNPHVAITDDAVAATSRNVETLARLFHEHVALARPTTPDDVRALQCAFVTGASAVPMLADEVMSLDAMLAAIAAGTFGVSAPSGAAEGDGTMTVKASKSYEDAIAALRKAAEGDDEEAKKAKRMLAAELAEDEPAKPSDDDPKGEDEKEPAKEPDGDEAKALAARAEKAAAEALAATERLERQQLLAARPDLDEATRELLATASVADVKKFLEKHPRRAPGKPAATAVVSATRPEGSDVPVAASEHKSSLDALMGLAPAPSAPKLEGTRQVFPVMNRAQGAAWLDQRAKAKGATTA